MIRSGALRRGGMRVVRDSVRHCRRSGQDTLASPWTGVNPARQGGSPGCMVRRQVSAAPLGCTRDHFWGASLRSRFSLFEGGGGSRLKEAHFSAGSLLPLCVEKEKKKRKVGRDGTQFAACSACDGRSSASGARGSMRPRERCGGTGRRRIGRRRVALGASGVVLVVGRDAALGRSEWDQMVEGARAVLLL